jgi:hypothetical protein
MADQSKLIFVNGNCEYEETSVSDSLLFESFKTANFELTDTLLGDLNGAIDTSTGLPSAGSFIRLDGGGLISQTMLNLAGLEAQLDHNALSNLTVGDPHTQYILVDGTRAFTGDQSLGGNKITNVGVDASSITGALDAVNKAYVDAVAQGLRPKGNVVAATTGNIDISSAPATIDGVTPGLVDRILVKDQTDPTENGIYEWNGAATPMTRSADQDNNPLAEIVNGVYIPQVIGGTVNGGKPFFISSVGTGSEGLHTIGTDDIVWEEFTSPSQLAAGQGILISSNIISVRLAANGGLKFVLDEIAVEPADFAGTGLQDDGADNLEIDFADTATEMGTQRAVAASDLSANGANQGANIIGADPTTISQSSATTIQGILEDLSNELENVDIPRIEYTVDTGETVALGDFLTFAGNDLTRPLDVTVDEKPGGIAFEAGTAGQVVQTYQKGEVAAGVISGGVAGTQYFWDGSALTTTKPSAAGTRVWRVGYAKNATDLFIDWELIKVNS